MPKPRYYAHGRTAVAAHYFGQEGTTIHEVRDREEGILIASVATTEYATLIADALNALHAPQAPQEAPTGESPDIGDDDLRARFTEALRLRIIIDNQDAADAPESPFTLNVYTDDPDGTPSRIQWDIRGGALVGDSIPDLLHDLAYAIEFGQVER